MQQLHLPEYPLPFRDRQEPVVWGDHLPAVRQPCPVHDWYSTGNCRSSVVCSATKGSVSNAQHEAADSEARLSEDASRLRRRKKADLRFGTSTRPKLQDLNIDVETDNPEFGTGKEAISSRLPQWHLAPLGVVEAVGRSSP